MPTQELLRLPLRSETSARRGEPTNLYLPKKLKSEAAQVAHDRYGYSLSELTSKLLEREVKLRRGLLTARLVDRPRIAA